MTEQYKTVYEGGEGELVEKKSRFIATVRPVKTEEEANQFVEEMRKKYWDARHNCWAFILGERQEFKRCSDDGEPSQTAGKPMMDVLTGAGLTDVAVVVTRYFGGTLLGTGGLVRAYSGAVQEGLKNSTVITKYLGVKLSVTTDYNGVGKLQYLFEQKEISILSAEYTDTVVCLRFWWSLRGYRRSKKPSRKPPAPLRRWRSQILSILRKLTGNLQLCKIYVKSK